MVTERQVLDALSKVEDPEIHKDIVSLGMVRDLKVAGGAVSFTYMLTTPACPLRGQMEKDAREAVLRVQGVRDVRITMSANVQKDVRIERALPGSIKNVVAVGSGKGGVGKSTVACNLAVSLAADGARVGLLDADVYGPNQPQMLGISNFEPSVGPDNKIQPPVGHGVKLMSMGFLMQPDQPVIWRGPMLHGAITQFLKDVVWGELDYLVVDLPPGTGDVQLSLCQTVPLTGAVIVTTPQTIALSDVRKAVAMFQKLNVPVLGVVENMSEFVCPKCETHTRVFSQGGAKTLSDKYQIPVLGQIPLDPRICESGETGSPAVIRDPSSSTAQAFRMMAKHVAAQVSLANYRAQNLEIKTVASS